MDADERAAGHQQRVGVVRCALAAVLFGASTPAAAALARDVPAVTLAGLLYLGAALAVAPFVVRRPPGRAAVREERGPLAVAVVAGGALGPALLVLGLTRIDAASASILLNLELVATVALAATVFREHLGRRVVVGAALVAGAGAVLTWQPGASVEVGALLVAAACACWGVDNGVTARIQQLSPEAVVLAKGVVAGTANVAIGLVVAGAGAATVGAVAGALLVGAFGYGASITLWVKGARDLGAARAQVIFATAPFVGAGLSWLALGEAVRPVQVLAALLAAFGVAVSLDSAHEHPHRHGPVTHDHEHTHPDAHHDHDHPDGAGAFVGRHHHAHEHVDPLVHVHAHVPDLHHHHDHDHDARPAS